MRYNVNAPGVEQVLKHTGDEADDFKKDVKPLDTAVPAALGACGNSAIIGGALETFLHAENRRLAAIANRVDGCLSGAALATVAYVHADYKMMRTAQENAAKAKTSHIPSKWLKKR